MDKYAHLLAMNKEQQSRYKKKAEELSERLMWRERSYSEINKLDEPLRSKGKRYLDYYSGKQDSGNCTLGECATSLLIKIATKTADEAERVLRLKSLINNWNVQE